MSEEKRKPSFHLNTMHQEFVFRFRNEFEYLANTFVFLEEFYRNEDALFPNRLQSDNLTIDNLACVSGELMGLILCRLWESHASYPNNAITIPVLLREPYGPPHYLGFHCLQQAEVVARVQAIVELPEMMTLKFARTEVIAHSLIAGGSNRRRREIDRGTPGAEWTSNDGYRLTNKQVQDLAETSLEILIDLLDSQIVNSRWQKGLSLDEHLVQRRASTADMFLALTKRDKARL